MLHMLLSSQSLALLTLEVAVSTQLWQVMSTFEDIPSEVIVQIFNHVAVSDLKNSILLVSKRWCSIAEDPILWKNVVARVVHNRAYERTPVNWSLIANSLTRKCIRSIVFTKHCPKTVIFQLVGTLGSQLNDVVLKGSHGLALSDLKWLSHTTPHLINFSLNEHGFTTEEIQALCLHGEWKQLKRFYLQYYGTQSKCLVSQEAREARFSIRATISLFSRFNMLESVSLSGYPVTEELLKELFQSCKYLRHLDLSHCDVSDEDIKILGQEIKLSNRLATLNLNGCRNLVDSLGLILLNQQQSLTTLSLQYIELKQSICRSISELSSICHLDLGNCKLFGNALLLTLIPAIRRLSVLNMKSCVPLKSKEILSCFSSNQNYKYMTELNLGSCLNLDDECLIKICQRCPSIESLDISSCLRVSNQGLQAVFLYSKQLTSLSLRWCINITDLGICGHHETGGYSPRLSDLQVLEKLDLSHCTKLTNKVYDTIKDLKNLKCLNLNGCKNINDHDLHLVASCKALEEVSLSCCNVTDAGVMVLVSSLSRLRSLDISKCAYVTDMTIESIIDNSKRMEQVDARLCENISLRSLSRLQSSLSTLAFLLGDMCVGDWPGNPVI